MLAKRKKWLRLLPMKASKEEVVVKPEDETELVAF